MTTLAEFWATETNLVAAITNVEWVLVKYGEDGLIDDIVAEKAHDTREEAAAYARRLGLDQCGYTPHRTVVTVSIFADDAAA